MPHLGFSLYRNSIIVWCRAALWAEYFGEITSANRLKLRRFLKRICEAGAWETEKSRWIYQAAATRFPLGGPLTTFLREKSKSGGAT
jgi:hypothetical protein